MIHFEHNAVDNADAILEELGSINYLYSYYHSDKFFDLAHKDQNLYLKCVKDHVNGKFAYHFMKLTVHDNIDTLPTHTKALCKHIQSQQFIDTANQIFNKKIGYVPSLFSYPFGEYSEFMREYISKNFNYIF